MATISTNRATMPRVNPNIKCGASNARKVATATEQANLRKAISHLQKSLDATTDSAMLVNLSSAFNLTRTIILDRR